MLLNSYSWHMSGGDNNSIKLLLVLRNNIDDDDIFVSMSRLDLTDFTDSLHEHPVALYF